MKRGEIPGKGEEGRDWRPGCMFAMKPSKRRKLLVVGNLGFEIRKRRKKKRNGYREKRGRRNLVVDIVFKIWKNIGIVSIEGHKLLHCVCYLRCLSFSSHLSQKLCKANPTSSCYGTLLLLLA